MDESSLLSPHSMSPLSAFVTSSDSVLVDSGMKFMDIVEASWFSSVIDILAQLTPMAVLHFGANAPLMMDNLTELKEVIQFRAETDSEQLALLGLAFTILDELLPLAVMKVWSLKNESKELESESTVPNASITAELKEWKRNLQHSFDKLRDHFCRQYICFTAGLICKASAISNCGWRRVAWERENTENLLARLTETVVMWLSEEQEFWDVFEDESVPLRPLGLQQLILDMHFTVEIACFAGYPSRHVQQIASAIITRAIRTFSARGIDPQSALPEDEWFVETAKTAINKLLLGTSGSDASEIDEDHVILHDEMVSDSDETASSLSSTESFESFASASMELLYKDQRFMLTSIVDFVVAIAMEADVSCQGSLSSIFRGEKARENRKHKERGWKISRANQKSKSRKQSAKMGLDGNSKAGITGTINQKKSETEVPNLTGKVHLLPCCIKYDGPSVVSHYFKPKPTCVEVEEMKVEEAHFRGRKLQGATLPIPDGYSGFVIGKKSPGKRKAF
ncbi:exocyst complex component EXO84C [Populus alba x Populus x berolinensis]|nr:exocyst complex component EXO84C [Populus alba x Populus x berolinensis]